MPCIFLQLSCVSRSDGHNVAGLKRPPGCHASQRATHMVAHVVVEGKPPLHSDDRDLLIDEAEEAAAQRLVDPG